MRYPAGVDWQKKVREYVRLRGTSLPKLAEKAGLAYMTLKRAVDNDNTWQSVSKAIQLARAMGMTVEELFDPNFPIPAEDDPGPRFLTWDERQAAIEQLAKMDRADVLERIARGIPPESEPEDEAKSPKQNRSRKP